VSTPEGRPNSDTHAAACHRWSDDDSREGATSRDVTGQGPRAFRSRFRPPPRRPLASVDLPQPIRPGHPVSQIRVGRRLEIATTNAHAVTRARKNGSARRSVRYAQRADRAALHASSRKKRVRNCTQGAFHRRAREQFRKIARSASGPHGCPRGPACWRRLCFPCVPERRLAPGGMGSTTWLPDARGAWHPVAVAATSTASAFGSARGLPRAIHQLKIVACLDHPGAGMLHNRITIETPAGVARTGTPPAPP
jgi:hypothetical protein